MADPAFDDILPGRAGRIIRCAGERTEVVALSWGFKPRGSRASPIINVRAEGRAFRRGRCLVPATEFFVHTGPRGSKTRWRVTVPAERWFCLAGLWQPASEDWPEAYAVITIPAGDDLSSLTRRQMAILPRSCWRDWLRQEQPARDLLQPPPPGSLSIGRT